MVLNDYVVHFISGTVSPKEDKYKTSVAQVGTVSIETGNISMCKYNGGTCIILV